MTDDQARDVRDLTKQGRHHRRPPPACDGATRCCGAAPGERTFADPVVLAAPVQERPQGSRSPGRLPGGGAPRTNTGGSSRGGSGRGGSGNGGRQGAGREAAGAGAGASRAGGTKRSGTARTGGRSGSTTVYTSTSGGAAAFSAGTRAGSGRGGR